MSKRRRLREDPGNSMFARAMADDAYIDGPPGFYAKGHSSLRVHARAYIETLQRDIKARAAESGGAHGYCKDEPDDSDAQALPGGSEDFDDWKDDQVLQASDADG